MTLVPKSAGPIAYRGPLAEGYPRGRNLSTETMTHWMSVAAQYIPAGPAPLLDLGAGTGRFSSALAERCGVPVLALEPAVAMRKQYQQSGHGAVHPIGGRAEALPFAGGVVKAVWASQVAHHLANPVSCAEEIRRVLKPGGRLLLRGGFHDVERIPPLHRYFPGLRARATEGADALAALGAALARVGLRRQAHEVVEQISAASLREFHEQALLRARSPLLRLTDEEFAEGVHRLGADAARETSPHPVVDQVDLVVFG